MNDQEAFIEAMIQEQKDSKTAHRSDVASAFDLVIYMAIQGKTPQECYRAALVMIESLRPSNANRKSYMKVRDWFREHNYV